MAGAGSPLEDNDLSVLGALHVGLGPAAQHVRAHVGENDSPAVEPLTILTEGLVVEVVRDLLLVRGAARARMHRRDGRRRWKEFPLRPSTRWQFRQGLQSTH